MVERKNQLGNVAFGGNWSEELLILDELRQVLSVIDTAVHECVDRDVINSDFLEAMVYVRNTIEKGPMLESAFLKALRLENQNLRQAEAQRIARMIRVWAGI